MGKLNRRSDPDADEFPDDADGLPDAADGFPDEAEELSDEADEPADEADALADDSIDETERPTRPLPALAPGDMAVICPECNGAMTWARVSITNHFVNLEELHLEAELRHGMFRHHTSLVRARVCVDCGFIKLYAITPQNLL
jgi:hypothetical protein